MLTTEKVLQGFTAEWTAEDRLLAVAVILPGLQKDIEAGRYSAMGRPNITSLQHIMSIPAHYLESQNVRQELEPALKELQALYK